MEARAMFVRDGASFVGTSLTSGGWDRRHANGATVLALLGHCLDDVPTLTPMSLARLTTDLVRPVPVGTRLHVDSRIAREGKKLQLVELRLCIDDVEHARASALRLRTEEVPTSPELPESTTTAQPASSLLPPEAAESLRGRGRDAPGFLEAIEMRRARYRDRGGSGCWVRLAVPVVADEAVRPTARLTFAFDCANQIGVEKLDAPVTSINPDVSAHVLREPVGEWIAITGDTRFQYPTGRGLSVAEFSDRAGLLAVGSLCQLVQPREP